VKINKNVENLPAAPKKKEIETKDILNHLQQGVILLDRE
jgi:hypothetical protein